MEARVYFLAFFLSKPVLPFTARLADLAQPHGRRLRQRRRSQSSVSSQSGGGGQHRRRSSEDGVDDLAVVDALQIDGRDTEVGVTELALDDGHRNALARHFDRVGVTQLVRNEPSSYAGIGGEAAQLQTRR